MNIAKPISKFTRRCSTVAIALGSLVIMTPQTQAAEPVGYVKLAPLQTLVQKVAGISGKISDPQQAAMLPMLAGMMLGDPGLSSPLSVNDITLVILDDFDALMPPIVAVATLPADAQARQALEAQGLTIKDYKGKAFVSMNGGYLVDEKALDGLLTISGTQRSTDIEIGFWVARLFQNKEEIINALMAQSADIYLSEENRANVSAILDVVFDEFLNVDSTQIGINLSTDNIQIQQVVNSVKGSDLERYFKLPAGGKVPEAKFVQNQGWMTASSVFNMGEMIGYIEGLAKKLEGNLTGAGKDAATEFLKTSKHWKGYAGTSAFSMGGSPEQPEINQVAKADISFDELKEAYEASQALGELFVSSMQAGGEIETSNVYSEIEVDGNKVLKAVYTVKTSYDTTETVTLSGIVGDYQVTTADEETYAKIAKAIKEDKAVENAIGNNYELPEGTVVLGNVNPAAIVRAGLAQTFPGSAERFDANLAGKQLKPVLLSLSNRNGRLISLVSIPVDTIATISKATPSPSFE